MNVTLTTDCDGVSQKSRDGLNGRTDIPLCERFALWFAEFLKRQDRPSPRTKILRSKRLTADLLQILIHIFGSDCDCLIIFADVFEQFLAGQFLTLPDNPRDAHRNKHALLQA